MFRQRLFSFLSHHIQDPSMWCGLTMFVTAFAMGLTPELMKQTLVSGTALTGLVGIMTAGKS